MTILKILGCGTSSGVPLILCKCSVCRSKNPKNKRLRTSAWLQIGGKSFLIDTSTDLRQQALRAKIPRVDAVLYTHPHADHIYGIDDMRGFNFSQKAEIPVFGNQWTCDDLPKRFPYIFPNSAEKSESTPTLPPKPLAAPLHAYAVPRLNFHLIDVTAPYVDILGEKMTPLPVMHGAKECLGYRFGRFAYVTDCSYIPPTTLDRMKGLSVLVLDCLRFTPHNTHLNFEKAMEIIALLKPTRTYLTHLGHEFDYSKSRKKLPPGVFFAYDGLTITIREKGK